ncbi:probable long-chain-alcohol O-fatty-acyltransferase 1 [Trifolium pratense]|uniref:probable long-chain-alcohol O-fatty-acyltransferase 1 n=1 Tax=Trifolium pratense TaxID=57577 RepID=UPI001E6908F7|nr:probable long-chain-alcohol O-fatty-acyltransferase 1 [Trifolium pratense]
MLSPNCIELEVEIKTLIKVWLKVLTSLCYCYFISSNIPKGILRLLSLSPILYLFTILPFQLSFVLPIGITSFFITWLTNFKLILFAFDLGPISSNPKISLPLFLILACLPIRITQKQKHPLNQNQSKFNLLLPIKTLLFGLFLIGLNGHIKKKVFYPTITIVSLYCSLIYLLLDLVVGFFNILINSLFGIRLELPSNEPYLSTSLGDFWGKRWNLMVTYILRHTIYIPMRILMSKTILGPQWAPLFGIIATFLVSGLMHELLFYHVTRVTPTWEVTCFFVLHGVCVVVEVGLRKWLGQKCRVHWAISGPITVAFVVATAAWLFFPPLLRDGADQRSIEELNNVVHCVMKKFRGSNFFDPHF